jgi:hypothetical protein
MTINKQSMLTTVLAVAVTVLVVDRAIEPAQAQQPSISIGDLTFLRDQITDETRDAVADALDCLDISTISTRHYDGGSHDAGETIATIDVPNVCIDQLRDPKI